jgi:hypothetical protein
LTEFIAVDIIGVQSNSERDNAMTNHKDGLQDLADKANVARDEFLREFVAWMDANPDGTFGDWLTAKGYVLIP